ncbi:unnamed protein product [Cochlearia groenlandica]
MAVEAYHMNVFSPQFISNNTDFVKFEHNMNHHGEFNLTGESLAVKNSESDLICNNLNSSSVFSPSTKRPRDSHFGDSDALSASAFKRRSLAFSDGELLTMIQNQQQSEIDRFVAQQTEKLRTEIKTRQKTQTRMLAFAVQNAILKKLKERDDEIARLRNANWVLQERANSLYVENQIWREIAQTNEANATNLRTNLDQVLAQIETFPNAGNDLNAAESSCGSCVEGGETVSAVGNGGCKRCGEREASVLVLPCRHLCLCTVCGSALVRTCPVCDSVMNASVHINMSF